ncbi:methyl-accepting chemotaxis protein [Paraburkholderia guartelaensis]|uniref:methyl-accepting chemotaxis protein n=1 Tax=Paraburkholderia guartelaensis TaxID=2546446 RepID=UPI002AB5E6DE|nr:methyl-accepting chemotaxis protein [Paraburkholderia guartelaensis]
MKLKDTPVRRALLAILAFFALLVIVTGAVAVRSLDQTAVLSDKIRTHDAATIYLKDVYLNNLKARSALARAYIAQSSNPSAKDAAVTAANTFYATARKSFEAFQAIPKESDAEQAASQEVEQTFRAHAKVFDHLFELVRKEDMSEYVAVNEGPMTSTSVAFGKASEAFFSEQSAASDRLDQQRAQKRHNVYVVMGSVVASALALIALSWWALSRILVRPLGDAAMGVGQVARGNLTAPLPEPSENEIGKLALALREMQQNLTHIVANVRAGTDSMVSGIRELATGNADLSARTEQQAASLEETAASMQQLTATVRQNSEAARQASTLAAEASQMARDGGNAVRQIVETMQSISQSSDSIRNIISVIEGIAFQTNILALNAAVEAARAGDDGRGFAVVAGEVRSLAQRSASAAKEIKQLIEDSTQRVHAGSAQVDSTGRVMDNVVISVQRVTDLMREISAASEEQTAGIEQVGKAVTQMDQVTQQNAALVEEAAAATHALESQAESLAGTVSVFRLGS